MRILLLHNKYQQAGGEDKVFESEAELLSEHDHVVDKLVFDNKDITTLIDKILSGIMGIYNFRSARTLQRRINDFKPDIIHVHNFVPLASPSVFFVARSNNLPVVLTLHNYRLICPSATLFHNNKIYEKSLHTIFPVDAIIKGVYRNSIVQTAGLALMTSFHNIIGTWKRKVDKFIVLTEFARSKFSESALRISRDKLVLKPNFINDPGKGFDKRDDFFLFIGRLTQEKGIEVMLSAFKRTGMRLIVIGDGPMRDLVETTAGKHRNIEYLGFSEKEVIMNQMKRAKALIFPSLWYEGFPITLLEALATGTPVIGSEIGSIAEIVKDKYNGLLFETGSETDLIRAINDLQLVDAKAISDNARNTYLEQYTPERNYQTLINIYRSAIKERTHE